MLRALTSQTFAVALLALANCAPSTTSREVTWDLRQDIDTFNVSFGDEAAGPYRIAQLREASRSEEYQRFMQQISGVPLDRPAFIYYEAASGASHYFFALGALSQNGCSVYVSDDAGAQTWSCQGVPEFRVVQEERAEPRRDPAIAVLIQFDDRASEPTRTLRLLKEVGELASANDLFARIERQFERPRGD